MMVTDLEQVIKRSPTVLIPQGYSNNNLDCDDTSSRIYPGAFTSNNDCEITAIDENRTKDISLWPNPAKDNIRIDSGELWDKESTEVKIISMNGKSHGLIIHWENNVIDIRVNLVPGLYLLCVQDRNHILKKKIIVR